LLQRAAATGLAIAPAGKTGRGRALEQLAAALRALPLPVLGRIADDRLLLDMRCLEQPADLLDQIGLLRLSGERR